MQQKRLLFIFLLSGAIGFSGHSQANDTITTSSNIATFKFRAGDSTYIWSGENKQKGEMGSRVDVIVRERDSTQGLYVVSAAGGNGDNLKIAFIVIGKSILRRSKTSRQPKVSVQVDAHLYAYDWDNLDEMDSTVQVSFTNLHDNMADGTFSCLVSSGSKKLTVNYGEFHNLKIYKKIQH